MVDPVNALNRKFTKEFAANMNALKPTNPRDPDYRKKILAWQRSFAFTKALQKAINDENNRKIYPTGVRSK
jgi:hypothetical protein